MSQSGKSKTLVQAFDSVDGEFSALFGSVKKLAEELRSNTKSISYKYPSQIQATSVYQYAKTLSEVESVTPDFLDQNHDDLAKSIRVGVYDQGKVAELLGAVIWTKKSIIGNLLTTISELPERQDIISILILCRATFEHVGASSLLERDLHVVLQNKLTTLDEKIEVLAQAAEIITRRGKGTRIDWETYLGKTFREGKKKSYKPKAETVDATAVGLLDGVDLLDKNVRGVRKAYEFLSEFAHPNIGAHMLLVSKARTTELSDGVRIWERVYDDQAPILGIREFERPLKEVLELLVESVGVFRSNAQGLNSNRLILIKYTREFVRRAMKNHPLAFVLREPCPCFSGKPVRDCCGKSIRKIHKKHGVRGS